MQTIDCLCEPLTHSLRTNFHQVIQITILFSYNSIILLLYTGISSKYFNLQIPVLGTSEDNRGLHFRRKIF